MVLGINGLKYPTNRKSSAFPAFILPFANKRTWKIHRPRFVGSAGNLLLSLVEAHRNGRDVSGTLNFGIAKVGLH